MSKTGGGGGHGGGAAFPSVPDIVGSHMGFNIVQSRPLNELPKPVHMLRELNLAQMQQINLMRQQVTSISLVRERQKQQLFNKAFDVVLGRNHGIFHLSDDMKESLVRRHWMPWLKQVDDWIEAFGFAPFYFKTLEQSVPLQPHQEQDDDDDDDDDASSSPVNTRDIMLNYPVTPAFGTGTVTTYMYEKQQYLLWRWADDMVPQGRLHEVPYDTHVLFLVKSLPDVSTGLCCSSMATLLQPWFQLQNSQHYTAMVRNRMLNPRSVVEFHPSTSGMGSGTDAIFAQSLQAGLQFGFGSPQQQQLTQQQQQPQQQQPWVTQFLGGVHQAHLNMYATAAPMDGDRMAGLYTDDTLSTASSASSVSATGSQRQQQLQVVRAMEELEMFMADHPHVSSVLNLSSPSLQSLPNSHRLKPYERVVPLPSPHVEPVTAIQALQDAFDHRVLAALCGDLDAATPTQSAGVGRTQGRKEMGGGGGGGMSPMTTTEMRREKQHEHLKLRMDFYSAMIKYVFQLAYQQMLEDMWDDATRLLKLHMHQLTLEQQQRLEEDLDIQIVLHSTTGTMTRDEILTYYSLGVIDEDEAYRLLIAKVGFGDTDTDTTGQPTPPEFVKRMKQLYRTMEDDDDDDDDDKDEKKKKEKKKKKKKKKNKKRASNVDDDDDDTDSSKRKKTKY